MTLEESIRTAAEETDRYESTVHALLTFAAYVIHDGQRRRTDGFFGFGRRMDRVEGARAGDEDRSPEGQELAPEAEEGDPVTPDLVAQKSSRYGLVAEAKAGMAHGDEVWEQYVSRLSAYDRTLEGWWTDNERIETADAVLLIHRSRSRPLVRFLEAALEKEALTLSERTAVVEFVRSDQVDTYYSFRSEWGKLSDAELSPRLEETVEVPLAKVIDEFAAVQFYDSPPPTPMLMAVLWGDFFGRIGELEFDQESRTWPLTVDVSDVTEELQRAYGSRALDRDERSCEFPREQWIRSAMEQLVRVELASRGNDDGIYHVHLRSFDGDLQEALVRRLHRRREAASNETGAPSSGDDQTVLPLDEL